MMRPMPYRITIELASGPRGKTIVLTGETPDHRHAPGPLQDADACAIAANALAWQSTALSAAATDQAAFARISRAMNMPLNAVPY